MQYNKINYQYLWTNLIYLGSKKKKIKNQKTYILRKLDHFQLSLLQGTLVYLYGLQSW